MRVGRLGVVDPNSYATPDDACITDIHLEWDLDFKKQIITGSAKLRVEKKRPNVQEILLDTRDLTIHSVKSDETSLDYTLGDNVHSFGSKLTVKLPSTDSTEVTILISYNTARCSSALQWLTADQTAGKKQPYLFSQCEAICCRSLVPCQDTPAVKAPYTAQVTAPSELTVLMSAVREGKPHNVPLKKRKHYFRQDVPVPSYLIAIVAGALESRKIGPRTHIWSEKEMIEKAAWEFEETETIIKAAESLVGPYVWGDYDILVLPPSFSFGGMENPCLTFVTPTTLAGDRSLVSLIAHETAHSWTGNLVTNRNFEHFWLNEGFTMFLERKIISRLYGEQRRHFDASGGIKSLRDCINNLGHDNPWTCLNPDLTGVDPDESFSVVPYEKGHTFLFYLEEKLGGPEVFDKFLRAYVEKFKYKSIETKDFKDFLLEFFKEQVDSGALTDVDWETWLHKPGMPPVIPNYDKSLSASCMALCERWDQWDIDTDCPFKNDDLNSLTSEQVIQFLALILDECSWPKEKLQKMEELYGMSTRKNAEIRFNWLRLCIKSRWKEQSDEVVKFITEQGRMKFVRPLYRELYKWDETRELAVKTFQEHRKFYMNLAATFLAKDLELTS